MELSITCSNYELAKKLDQLKIDNLIVGIKEFSCRFNNYFSIDEIEKLSNELVYSNIIVCLNAFYFEHEIDSLIKLLKKLDTLKIKKIMFADFAIPQIVLENNLKLVFQYSPETIVTSYGQFDFYFKNNIKSVSIATELTWLELSKICENKNQMHIAIKAHGLGFVMYSRWPMISNYIEDNNINKYQFENIDYWLIKEEKRIIPNVIYEDSKGTHMMTGYYICSIKKLKQFKEMGIDEIVIDSLFINDNKLIEIVSTYQSVLNNESSKDLDLIFDDIKSKSELPISEGFFGETKDILHTLEVENHE